MTSRLNVVWQTPKDMEAYLQSTSVVDADSEIVLRTVREVVANSKTAREAIKSILHFARDSIIYALTPQLEKASTVLMRRTGYCVSKSTAIVAMARAASIPARYHFASIKKEVMEGIVGGVSYKFMPKVIPSHCWAEVYLDNRWIGGDFSFDRELLEFQRNNLLGVYKVSVDASIDWDGEHDLIVPAEFIIQDLGTYTSPEPIVRKMLLWPLWQYLQNREIDNFRAKLRSKV